MERHWIDEFFGQAYLDTYLEMLTPERTQKEVDLIEKALDLKKEDRILDLASGHGRHAIELARRGYRNVLGLDYTPVFIEKAKKDAEAAGVKVELALGDMRALKFENEFDAIYNYFSAMFFFSDEVNQGILDGVARALKPGGRFLWEGLNRDWIVRNYVAREWWQVKDGPRVLEERRFDPHTDRLMTTRYLHYPNGREVKQEFELAVYPISMIKRMMEDAGLNLQEVKVPEGELFPPDSQRLLILAQKPKK